MAFTPLLLDGPLVSGTSGLCRCIHGVDEGIESHARSGNQPRRATSTSALDAAIVSFELSFICQQLAKDHFSPALANFPWQLLLKTGASLHVTPRPSGCSFLGGIRGSQPLGIFKNKESKCPLPL